MSSKEEIALAKDAVEAIKKISKGKWEWEPKWNDKAITSVGTVAQVTMILTNGQICLRDRLDNHFYGGRQDGKWVVSGSPIEELIPLLHEELIPLLHWERIEEILEGMGYRLWVEKHLDSEFTCTIAVKTDEMYEKRVCRTQAKTRQTSVMLAVIELGKEKANEKD